MKPATRLLKDDALHGLIEQDGFASTPFLNSGEVSDLYDAFYRLWGSREDVVHNSLEAEGADKRRKSHDKILSVCRPALEKHFRNHKVVIAMYFTKKHGQNSTVGLHNDPSMVMEGYGHLGIWIPLLDCNEKNGTMNFVRGSHKFFPPYWAKTVTVPYGNLRPLLGQYTEAVPAKAGDAIIFDNNTIHCTYNNLSDKTRVAVILKIVDKDARLISLFSNPGKNGGKIEILAQEDDYYLSDQWQDNNIRPPIGKFNGFLDYRPTLATEAEMLKLLSSRRAGKKPGILRRLTALFG